MIRNIHKTIRVFCMFSILLTFVGLSTQQIILMRLEWIDELVSLTDSFIYISWVFQYFMSKDISRVPHIQILLRISISFPSHERHKLLLALFMMFWTMHLKITFDICGILLPKWPCYLMYKYLSVNIVVLSLSSKPIFPRRFTVSSQLAIYMLNFTLFLLGSDYDNISRFWLVTDML